MIHQNLDILHFFYFGTTNSIFVKKNLCIRWSPLSFWSLFSSAGAIGDGGPFIYYVNTCKKVSKRGQKIAIFAYFLYRKYAYVGGRGGSKNLKMCLRNIWMVPIGDGGHINCWASSSVMTVSLNNLIAFFKTPFYFKNIIQNPMLQVATLIISKTILFHLNI